MSNQFWKFLEDNDYLFTGRATTAIYLVLKSNKIKNKGILLPANICYAAVLAVVYSGNKPIFVDVNKDGNLNFEILETVNLNKIAAAIIPHMYGNPCLDIAKISSYLKKHGVIIIEDCALAMGAMIDGKNAGNFGDYAVFSFGYSKTLDMGYGGLLVTKKKLARIRQLNQKLNYYNAGLDIKLKLFSQLYRVIRNNEENDFVRYIYKGFPRYYRDCFLFQSTEGHNQRIIKHLATLDEIIKKRWENVMLYDKGLNYNINLEKYKYYEGAVPWRFNLLIAEKYKKPLIDYLLAKNIPVSDWYPVVTPIFGISNSFVNARFIEKRILNFPIIGLKRSQIIYITNSINEFWK